MLPMASKEELLNSIQPNMKLSKAFFLKVYGYEITYPGFGEVAIKTLEDAGCSKAQSYYDSIVTEREKIVNERIRPIAEWLKEQIDQDYERKTGDKLRVGKYSSSLQQKNYSKKQKENLIAKLERLKALI